METLELGPERIGVIAPDSKVFIIWSWSFMQCKMKVDRYGGMCSLYNLGGQDSLVIYQRWQWLQSAVVNKELSLMEPMAAAKAAIATASAHVATLTGAFPDTFFAGVMGNENQTSDGTISELGKYQREVIVSPQLQSDVLIFSHFADLAVCSGVANRIGQHFALTVAQGREKYRI